MEWLRRKIEWVLGLDRGFLSGEGGLPRLHFDPHWPGPLIGSSGSAVNFALGVLSLALIVILARRRSHGRHLPRLMVALAACGALIFPVVLLLTHLTLISIIVGVLIAAGVVWFLRSASETKLLTFAQVILAALYLSVISGALTWNVSLAAAGILTILYVYRREAGSRAVRVSLGALRGALVMLVLVLLNNPLLTRIRTLVEPSVVAVLLDDSLSMKVRDVLSAKETAGPTRLEAAADLFTAQDQSLLRKLAKVHTLRFFDFAQNARPLGVWPGTAQDAKGALPEKDAEAQKSLLAALAKLEPVGSSTQVESSILSVLDELQGQRVAGLVLLTDGRDTPTAPAMDVIRTLKTYGVRVYPVAIGADKAPTNIEIQSLAVQDSAFKDDLVNVKLTVRATGYEPGHPVHLKLTDKRTGAPLRDPDGKSAEKTINLPDDHPVEEELLFKPDQVGELEIKAEAEVQPGEIDEQDNVREASIAVLDARIAVLYVDGYPRWEYRYIKNEMIRDKTVDISCLLTSADQTFAQEGDPPHDGFPGRITRFPESIEELMPYDVILFGDVDPRQFTDQQLQLVNEFVGRRGGGFGMIAGPRWSPLAYRNTPIEAILPVNIAHVQADDPTAVFDQGFRPVLTKEGTDSSIFRFVPDRQKNEKLMKEELQPLFWYCRGITAKPGVGIVYAEHPTDLNPEGHKSPLLVLSHFGAGRSLFSAYDDSWRWRFYTGESIFDTYWVQQLRWLARGKKLGQRHITFTADRPVYELGQQVHLRLSVLDPALIQQLPGEISVQVLDDKNQPVRAEKLQKQAGQGDYVVSFTADRIGRYQLKLPALAGETSNLDTQLNVIEPRLELADPRVNRTSLSALASETYGQSVSLEETRSKLPGLIPSAARTTLLPLDQPLWNIPLAMALFVVLLSTEWVLRKVYGML